jgi:lysophospholipase L1-like esterase
MTRMARRILTMTLAIGLLAACAASGGTGAPSMSAEPSPSATPEPTPTPTPTLTPVPATQAPPSPSSPPTSASPSPTAVNEAPIELVAVGDSIFFNSPGDCPGCTGAIDRYADALAVATGRTVNVRNLSEHNGLQLKGLLNELERDRTRIDALKAADVILVGIAHNDAPMNRDDDPCDGAGGEFPDWSRFTAACIAEDIAAYTPNYERAYELIAGMRAGKPTILRTINRFNDWIGWPGHDLSAEGIAATRAVVAAWNDMVCGAAEANGFVCADISAKFNGEDGTEPANNLLVADYTHPSETGNKVIAQVLIDLGFAPLVGGND